MLKPRVVSRRLLVLCVVIILVVIAVNKFRNDWMAMTRPDRSEGNEIYRVIRAAREASQTPAEIDSLKPERRPRPTLLPVHIPGSKISVLSAVLRRDFPVSDHHRVMLTGWLPRGFRYTDFVCCLRSSEWSADLPSLQVRAAEYHMGDVLRAAAEWQHYLDAHYSCYLEPDVIKDLSRDVTAGRDVIKHLDVISLSTVSCSEGTSRSFSIDLPDDPENHHFEGRFSFENGGTNVKENADRHPKRPFQSASSDDVRSSAIDVNNHDASHDSDVSVNKDINNNDGNDKNNNDLLTFNSEMHVNSEAFTNPAKPPASKWGSPNIHDVAICGGVVDFNSTAKPRAVVEWLEHLKVFGARRVQFFYYNATREVQAVLDFYQEQGFLNAIHWNFSSTEIYPNHPSPPSSEVMDRDVSYADCLHRLSHYSVVVFLSLYHLILPHRENITLGGVAWKALHIEYTTGALTMNTLPVQPCPGDKTNQGQGQEHDQGQDQGQLSGLAFVPDLTCGVLNGSASSVMMVFPRRVAHVTHNDVFTIESFDKREMLTDDFEVLFQLTPNQAEVLSRAELPPANASSLYGVNYLRPQVLRRT